MSATKTANKPALLRSNQTSDGRDMLVWKTWPVSLVFKLFQLERKRASNSNFQCLDSKKAMFVIRTD